MLTILHHDEHLAPRVGPPADEPSSPKLGDFASIFDIWNGLGSSQSDDDASDRTLADSEVDDTSTSVESVGSTVLPLHKGPVYSLAVGGLFGGLDFAEVMAAGVCSEASLSGPDTKDGSDSDDDDDEDGDGDEHEHEHEHEQDPVARNRRMQAERIKVERSIKASIRAEHVKAKRIKAERIKAGRIKAKQANLSTNKKGQRSPELNPRSPPFLPSKLSPILMTTPTVRPTPSFPYEQDYGGLFKHFALYNPLAAFAPVAPVHRVLPLRQPTGYVVPPGATGDLITPSYWASSQEKLVILQVKLQREYDLDQTIQKKRGGKPIHVFVDLSNIVIGFYMRMRALRHLSPARWLAVLPPFFFHALAQIIERGRPAARKVTAGSVHDSANRADWPHYMDEAEALGYEMNILSRVSRQTATTGLTTTTPLSPRRRYAQHRRQKSGGGGGGGHAESGSDESARDEQGGAGPTRMCEQAVDEILQLKMCHSLLDHKPGTIVLATGDAAEAEFSDGFLRHVERAMSHGWRIELVSWTSGISRAWRELERRQKKGSQCFRIIELDTYAEELLGVFAG